MMMVRMQRTALPVRVKNWARVPIGLDHAHHEILLNEGAEDQPKHDRRNGESVGLEKVADNAHDQHDSHVKDGIVDRERADDAEHQDRPASGCFAAPGASGNCT